MKTRLPSNFGGSLTLGEVEKIDPGAIWRVTASLNTQRAEFSHDLDPLRTSHSRIRLPQSGHSIGARKNASGDIARCVRGKTGRRKGRLP